MVKPNMDKPNPVRLCWVNPCLGQFTADTYQNSDSNIVSLKQIRFYSWPLDHVSVLHSAVGVKTTLRCKIKTSLNTFKENGLWGCHLGIASKGVCIDVWNRGQSVYRKKINVTCFFNALFIHRFNGG